MPTHSKSKSHGGEPAPSKHKGPASKRSAGGEQEDAGVTRNAVTGRQLGRAALRAVNKNADATIDYLDSVLSASSLADLQRLVSDSKLLAFVERAAGGGRLFLTLQTSTSRDHKHHVNLPIRNVIRFKGSAASDSKKALGNTMQAGDFVIVDGCYASARLTHTQANSVRRVFRTYGLPVPAGFFADLETEDDAGGFAFDRTEEEEAEERAEEERQAAIARRAIVRAGGAGRGGAPRVSARAAVEALDDLEGAAALAAAERRADAVSEDDDEPAAAGGGAAAPSRSGPNRAERRAAEAAAREEAERRAAEEAAAAAGFNLYAADEEEEVDDLAALAALPRFAANKGWEELADELDIDAI